MAIISRLTTWAANQLLKAADLNNEFNNITNLFVNLDAGTTTWTNVKVTTLSPQANVAMSSFKLTGLAAGSANGDSVRFEQLHLLQAPVFGSETTGGTTTSATFVNLGATLSITPTLTTSTIYIFGSSIVSNSLSGGTTVMGCSGTTTGDLVTVAATPYELTNDGTNARGVTISGFFKDAPGTVAAQTYRLRFAANNGGTSKVGAGVDAGRSTYIIAFETV